MTIFAQQLSWNDFDYDVMMDGTSYNYHIQYTNSTTEIALHGHTHYQWQSVFK